MRGLVLFGRVRVARSTLVATGVSLLLTTLLQGRVFVAPIVPWDVMVLSSPVLPVVVAVVALRACEPVLQELELSVWRRRLGLLRLSWGTLVLVLLSLACCLSAELANTLHLGVQVPPAMLGLAFASFFASGLLGALVLGGDLGWVVPCLLVIAMVFFGRDGNQHARTWAWVLHGPDVVSTWLVPMLLVASALAGYWQSDTVGVVRGRPEALAW